MARRAKHLASGSRAPRPILRFSFALLVGASLLSVVQVAFVLLVTHGQSNKSVTEIPALVALVSLMACLAGFAIVTFEDWQLQRRRDEIRCAVLDAQRLAKRASMKDTANAAAYQALLRRIEAEAGDLAPNTSHRSSRERLHA